MQPRAVQVRRQGRAVPRLSLREIEKSFDTNNRDV
jgi:hypothetical protein